MHDEANPSSSARRSTRPASLVSRRHAGPTRWTSRLAKSYGWPGRSSSSVSKGPFHGDPPFNQLTQRSLSPTITIRPSVYEPSERYCVAIFKSRLAWRLCHECFSLWLWLNHAEYPDIRQHVTRRASE